MKNNFIKKTLRNGVKLYLYQDNSMKKTFVSYGVFYGSSGTFYDFYLDGKQNHVLPGCAHFLEHMLGEHSIYGNLYRYFDQKNYKVNAETGDTFTHYYFTGRDNIYESIKELITAIETPIFTEEDIKATSHAICEETKMTRDQKFRVALAICKRNLYSNIELVTDTLNSIGDEHTTRALDYNTLKACYDAFYNDENKFLIIGGDIDIEDITNYIESIYDNIKGHPNRRDAYHYSKSEKIRKEMQIEYMPTSDDLVAIGFKQTLTHDYTNKEIKYFLKFVCKSKLSSYKEFILRMKKENLLSCLEFIHTEELKDNFHFIIGASTKNYKEFLIKLKDELKKVDFSEKDFDLYKRQQIAYEASKIDNKYKSLRKFVYAMSYTDNFDDMDFIKALDFEKFMEFYKTLDFTQTTTALIQSPEKKKILTK